jgi:DNA-binding NarL/FixJ family response regulator
MTRLLLLDDAASVNELVARELVRHGTCEVTALARIEDLLADPAPEYDIAVVDLSFPGSAFSGIDALLYLYVKSPKAALIVLTQGDDWVADMLRDAWEAFPLATAISKSAPISTLVTTIERVIATGSAPVDPVLAPLLPSVRSPWRSIDGYARLVQHAGHAKLWRALINAEADPSYRDLSIATGRVTATR